MRNYWILGILVLGLNPTLRAQFSTDGHLSLAPGYEWNVFNSPFEYINLQGDTLTEDSLIRSDSYLSYSAKIEFEKKWKNHRLSWTNSADLLRYSSATQANATEINSKLLWKRTKNKSVPWGAWIRVRDQQRLGVNVLGSELLTPFSFRQIEPGIYYSRIRKGVDEIKFEGVYTYKWYDECVGCGLNGESVSLTQREYDGKIEYERVVGKIGDNEQKLTLTARFRDRQYFDWINYELLDPNADVLAQDPFLPFVTGGNYPARRWRYAIAKVEYVFPFTDDLKIKPVVEYTRRYDVTQGDFGFSQIQAALYMYFRPENWTIRAYVGYTDRDYTDRLAQQESGTPFPTLTYEYLRTKLYVERIVSGRLSIWAEYQMNNRNSNTSLLSTRVRRSYENQGIMAGVKFDLKKKFGT